MNRNKVIRHVLLQVGIGKMMQAINPSVSNFEATIIALIITIAIVHIKSDK